MIGGWGVPSIRLGTVYPPEPSLDLEPVEIAPEPLEINFERREAQRGIIRDPDEPLDDPFEAPEPQD